MDVNASIPRPTGCPMAICPAISDYKKELERRRRTEETLRETLSREETLLREKSEMLDQKDILIQQSAIRAKEFEHRVWNNVQMIAGVLSLQSRTSDDPETAAQLRSAADRVVTIGHVQQRLQSLEQAKSVNLERYLDALCTDLAEMLPPENTLSVKAIALSIPASIGNPLGFIVSELVTNAAKHANGQITVELTADRMEGYVLSVIDEGPGFPNDFDPLLAKGLGMKIVHSLVRQIGGQFQIGCNQHGNGACCTVLFSQC